MAWYCLAEILRAGATETGFVKDGESLPAALDIIAYREVLLGEAVRLMSLPPQSLPWYVKQQALLFIAANNAEHAPFRRIGNNQETAHYRELILFLKGEESRLHGSDFATLAVLCRRSFCDRLKASRLIYQGISPSRLGEIAERDPSFALEIIEDFPELRLRASATPRLRDDLLLDVRPVTGKSRSLAEIVLQGGARNFLRNEPAVLEFSLLFLKELSALKGVEVVTPTDVMLMLNEETWRIEGVKIRQSRVSPANSIYRPPNWCGDDQRWRFQLGFLIRFILSSRPDFTRFVRNKNWKEGAAIYRIPESHWYQRLYSLFSGRAAFGDDWIPVSFWIEDLLFALLSWPGCLAPVIPDLQSELSSAERCIEKRLFELLKEQGPAKSVLMLPMRAPNPVVTERRPLRACVVQTILPTLKDDFPDPSTATIEDLKFSDSKFRRRHSNHLSAALAAVERMLDLRETHKGRDGRLDWLILPELSVHPDDVKTHLLPFARAHKTIILAGLTYEELFVGQPLVNSALWIIPQWTKAQGLQVGVFRQGKQYLSPEEDKYNVLANNLQSFRPCQWLVGYEWSNDPENRPLWLTGSICYDATDLSLANDLKDKSDVFAIPSLNRDVKTFDQMALALHYHMFQFVVVANNGWYGGSNAYAPFSEAFERQVFHLHGQPQASIGFLEIDDIGEFLRRKVDAKKRTPAVVSGVPGAKWKFPPAGM